MSTRETRCLTVTIDAAFEDVCADLADPTTHPLWATEFFTPGAEPVGDGVYLLTSPMMGGPVRARIAGNTGLGCIDLYLAPDGAPFAEPLPIRVIPNGTGADVLWTLTRPDGLPDPAWREGLEAMDRELSALRARLERTPDR